jgi:hypothetical protein
MGVFSQLLVVSVAVCRMLILRLSRTLPDQTLTMVARIQRVVF